MTGRQNTIILHAPTATLRHTPGSTPYFPERRAELFARNYRRCREGAVEALANGVFRVLTALSPAA